MLFNPRAANPQGSLSCAQCGKPLRTKQASRRPRDFCSNGCRQAAYRERRQDAFSPYRVEENNEPAANSLKNSSTISTVEFRNKGTPSVPLNLLGGHRWPGAGSVDRNARVKAVINAEIGIGHAAIVSSDGAAAATIPSASSKRSRGFATGRERRGRRRAWRRPRFILVARRS
jgi:endogenous inhibitor of DNA gyrase (YacG/DUF329 family)